MIHPTPFNRQIRIINQRELKRFTDATLYLGPNANQKPVFDKGESVGGIHCVTSSDRMSYWLTYFD